MTLVDEINAETKARVEDFYYAKAREIMRAKGGMITSEDAYEQAKREHAPPLLKELGDKCFAEGKFQLYYIISRFLNAKDEATKEAARQEITALQKEAHDFINRMADPYSP